VNDLHLIKLEAADIPLLLEVSKSAGWPTTAGTWGALLGVGGGAFFGHRSAGGEIVSSAGIFNYGGLASLAMVLVKPAYRGRGLAKELITHCRAQLPPDTALMLVSTELGLPLYTRLGFKPVGQTRRMFLSGSTAKPGCAACARFVRPYTAADFRGVLSADAAALGVEREGVIRACVNAPGACFVFTDGSRVTGFAAAKDGPGVRAIGPVIAPDEEAALCLVESLIPANGAKVQIDPLTGHTGFLKALADRGFTVESTAPIMLFNGESLPGRRENLFAIASRAYG
jgi:GNAT superfamily N-acetyltransferase